MITMHGMKPASHTATSLHPQVAAEVRAYLARNRMSGRVAAGKLGWTPMYLSRRLSGEIPFDVNDLDALAVLLDIPVTAFFETPEPYFRRSEPIRKRGRCAPDLRLVAA